MLYIKLFYISYPSGVTHKSSWWAALMNKPRVRHHLVLDEGEHVPLEFQEEFMMSTMEITAALLKLLVDNSNVDVKVEVVDIETADEEDLDRQDDEDEPEWDGLETDTEDDETKIRYHSSDDDDNDDVEGGTYEDNDY